MMAGLPLPWHLFTFTASTAMRPICLSWRMFSRRSAVKHLADADAPPVEAAFITLARARHGLGR